ncbi:hypothetical protein CYMTET_7472 [Cymbomonas tetramitiformis]|uniref:EGF-like domain-containing protein n=1 Tax=Cymbomonas tetramitiformis TaxID=36881 RepID=A0AAE0LGU6_9CHLO|nr:hypothetical protein CYMTET_7472 [Cymbomonas tetramitiformis]
MAPLYVGSTEAGHIRDNSWRYYYLNVPQIDAGVRFKLAPGGGPAASSDGTAVVDTSEGLVLYVRRSTPPNEDTHDAACGVGNPENCVPSPAGSAPPELNPVVNIPSPGGFSWWLGIQNLGSDSHYRLTAEYTITPCPADCSDNGECVRGRCYCNAGYTGEDCSMKEQTRYTALKFKEYTQGYVGASAWRYYYVNTDRKSAALVVELEVPRSGTHGSPTPPLWLHLNRSDPPTEARSHKQLEIRAGEGKDVSTRARLVIERPGSFSWWIGVRGDHTAGGSYSLRALNVYPCLHDCAHAGQCERDSGSCFCQPGAGGIDCATADSDTSALTFGQTVRRLVSSGSWRYHLIEVPPSAIGGELQMELEQRCLPDDEISGHNFSGLGLFLAENEKPTEDRHAIGDHKHFGGKSTVSTMVLPATTELQRNRLPSRWWVGVYAPPGSCTGYVLSANFLKNCPSGCHAQGDCENGECRCHPGFRGHDCLELDAPDPLPLLSERYHQLRFPPPEWRVLSIKVPMSPLVSLLAAEVHSLEATPGGGCTSLEVYLRSEQLPTVTQFHARALEPTGGALASDCTYSLRQKQPRPGEWFMAVRRHRDVHRISSPTVGGQELHVGVHVELVMECAPACSAFGACINGTCVCQEGHTGKDCGTLVLVAPPVAPQAAAQPWRWSWNALVREVVRVMKSELSHGGWLDFEQMVQDTMVIACLVVLAIVMALACWQLLCRKTGCETSVLGTGSMYLPLLSPTPGGAGLMRSASWKVLPSVIISPRPITISPGSKPGNNPQLDIRTSLELQHQNRDRPLSPNILREPPEEGDLPVPVGAFRPPAMGDMRHRRVNSWGTPLDTVQRAYSLGNMLDSGLLLSRNHSGGGMGHEH